MTSCRVANFLQGAKGSAPASARRFVRSDHITHLEGQRVVGSHIQQLPTTRPVEELDLVLQGQDLEELQADRFLHRLRKLASQAVHNLVRCCGVVTCGKMRIHLLLHRPQRPPLHLLTDGVGELVVLVGAGEAHLQELPIACSAGESLVVEDRVGRGVDPSVALVLLLDARSATVVTNETIHVSVERTVDGVVIAIRILAGCVEFLMVDGCAFHVLVVLAVFVVLGVRVGCADFFLSFEGEKKSECIWATAKKSTHSKKTQTSKLTSSKPCTKKEFNHEPSPTLAGEPCLCEATNAPRTAQMAADEADIS